MIAVWELVKDSDDSQSCTMILITKTMNDGMERWRRDDMIPYDCGFCTIYPHSAIVSCSIHFLTLASSGMNIPDNCSFLTMSDTINIGCIHSVIPRNQETASVLLVEMQLPC